MTETEAQAAVQPAPAADFFNATDPFALFEGWFADATEAEINDPNAMSLATVDNLGRPNNRVVLLKGLDGPEQGEDRGFVFYTNLESAKGTELQGQPFAALNFHWKGLLRQIRVRGRVLVVTPSEADTYFASRPRGSQIGAWASQQSRPMTGKAELLKRVGTYTAKFGVGKVQRPPHWGGFCLTPGYWEFWKDGQFRLHDRLVYRRDGDGWQTGVLYP